MLTHPHTQIKKKLRTKIVRKSTLKQTYKININLLLIKISSLHVINILLILLPVLLSIAFMTIIERKQLAAHQRRVGPNTVGQLKFKNSFFNKTYHFRSFNTLIPAHLAKNEGAQATMKFI